MNNIANLMNEICRQQEYGRYLVMGFFVTGEQFAMVAPLLEQALPSMRARGQFRGLPVYIESETPVPIGWQTETVRGVRFAYSQLDATFPLTIDLTLFDLEQQLDQYNRETA
jgi:hypothetical protein